MAYINHTYLRVIRNKLILTALWSMLTLTKEDLVDSGWIGIGKIVSCVLCELRTPQVTSFQIICTVCPRWPSCRLGRPVSCSTLVCIYLPFSFSTWLHFSSIHSCCASSCVQVTLPVSAGLLHKSTWHWQPQQWSSSYFTLDNEDKVRGTTKCRQC